MFQELLELRDRASQTLPKDGTERMEAPLPFLIVTTATLPPAALWEGSLVYNTDINRLMQSDGVSWFITSAGGLFGGPSLNLSSTPVALTAAESGRLIINFNATREVDLPAPTTGLSYAFWTGGTGTLTLDILGTELILWPDGTSASGSFVMTSGQQVIIAADGNNWVAYAPNFNQLRASNIIRKQDSADEGGELRWEQSNNSTLAGDDVVTDLHINDFRLFENGSNFRGISLPIADFAASAGSRIGMVRMASGVATNVATLDIILPNQGFRAWKVILTNCTPHTDAQPLLVRTSTDGGSTYDSGASDYAWVANILDEAGGAATNTPQSDSADANMVIAIDVESDDNLRLNADFTIFDTGGTVSRKHAHCHAMFVDAAGQDNVFFESMGLRLGTNADIDALRFFFDSGNITTEWALYGIE